MFNIHINWVQKVRYNKTSNVVPLITYSGTIYVCKIKVKRQLLQLRRVLERVINVEDLVTCAHVQVGTVGGS